MKLSLLGALSSASGCIAAARWDVLSTCSRAWTGCSTKAPACRNRDAPSRPEMIARAHLPTARGTGQQLSVTVTPSLGCLYHLQEDVLVRRVQVRTLASLGGAYTLPPRPVIFFVLVPAQWAMPGKVDPPFGRAMAAPGRGGNPFSLDCGVGNMRKEAGTMEGGGAMSDPPFLSVDSTVNGATMTIYSGVPVGCGSESLLLFV